MSDTNVNPALEEPAARRSRTAATPRSRGLLGRALVGGSLAGAAAAAVVSLFGARTRGGAIGPINATSHVLWGDAAGAAKGIDLKHTLPGVLLNAGAGVFWGLVHESLRARLPARHPVAAVASGAAVAALAYVVDYHVIPRRLSPGWELRVSQRAVGFGFAALGVGLALAALARGRRSR